MRYTLRLREIVIGWSTLDERERSTREARGEFRPGLGWDLVEPIFVLRPEDPTAPGATDMATRYRRARDTLQLSLHAEDGSLVDTATIDIIGDPRRKSGLTMVVALVDDDLWPPL
jgi:hypothetical protein